MAEGAWSGMMTPEEAAAVVKSYEINHPGGEFTSPAIYQAADVFYRALLECYHLRPLSDYDPPSS